LHLMRDVVDVANRNIPVHANVKIDIKFQTHFANKAFVDLNYARNRFRRLAHRFAYFAARRGVENVLERRSEQTYADCRDDEANKNGRPMIRALPFLAANQRNRNANERHRRREHVSPMTPRVRLDGDAFDGTAKTHDIAEE